MKPCFSTGVTSQWVGVCTVLLPCSPESTRCKHDMPIRANLRVTTKVHRGGSRHVLGRDPCPTDGRTNLGKQKPDCKRLKTSSLIDPSHGTKEAPQFALQVIESCTTRQVSRMMQCEKQSSNLTLRSSHLHVCVGGACGGMDLRVSPPGDPPAVTTTSIDTHTTRPCAHVHAYVLPATHLPQHPQRHCLCTSTCCSLFVAASVGGPRAWCLRAMCGVRVGARLRVSFSLRLAPPRDRESARLAPQRNHTLLHVEARTR